MFRASSSIHAHFAHHVRGHSGPCISIHGHTWKLEVVLEARALDVAEALVKSRHETLGHEGHPPHGLEGELCGARNERPGGIKVAVFPFTPTSERLAEWLYRVACHTFEDDRVRVACGRIFESLHPSESIASAVA